ncbi:lipocalin family protein [Paenalcaligenes faecalis]|uniref:lipocalin family protein n=1 Tax=Paenalcaligenes faecalis TaxID=2980099 RepID=UPI0022B951D9|nr:lipocalin family protein [Paenalcaligenes faecalis]
MKNILCVSIAATLLGCTAMDSNLTTQADVDLNKYMGKWYEQARLPNRFQKDCIGDVEAEYVLTSNTTISVTNQCLQKDGSVAVASGEGRLAKAGEVNLAKLEVRFAPEWMSWLPFVWGDYWILRLEGNYEYSLVGTPNREYLWVLSRNKNADPEVVQQLFNYAQTQGFDINHMVLAP